MKVRAFILVVALAAMLSFVSSASATTSVQLAKRAHGNPFKCKVHKTWGIKQNQCVVRVVFARWPSVRRQVFRIIRCESGWDETQVTPPYGATGLAQFIRSTWRNLPKRFSRHSAKHPVYNVLAMRYVWRQDGNFHQWVCQ